MIKEGSEFVIFDEPTAALDPLAELEIFQQFVQLVDGKTALLIAHRLGPTRLADRVVVLDNGRIVEIGNPTELLQQNGKYAEMFAAQSEWYQSMRNTNTVPRRAVLRLIWQFIRIAPLPLSVTLLLRLINAGNRGFAPIIIAGFTNALINADGLLLWMGVYLVLMTLEILTDVFNGVTQTWFSNKAVLHFQQDLLRQAGQTPLLHFLDPDFHDNLSRATQGFSDRVVSWFRSVLDNVHSVASVCGLLGAVFIISSNINCMIALFVSSSIILFTRKPIARLELEQDRAAARPNRTQTAWAARLYERVNSPEVRLFTLQRWLLSKWEDAYRQLAAVEIGSLKRKTAWNALASLSSVFGYCVIVFVAAQTAQNGDPEKIAGIFTGLITAAAMLQGFLSYMARSMGNLAEQSCILRDLATLFTTQSTEERSVSDTTAQHQEASLTRRRSGRDDSRHERSLVPIPTRSDADAQGDLPRKSSPAKSLHSSGKMAQEKRHSRIYCSVCTPQIAERSHFHKVLRLLKSPQRVLSFKISRSSYCLSGIMSALRT